MILSVEDVTWDKKSPVFVGKKTNIWVWRIQIQKKYLTEKKYVIFEKKIFLTTMYHTF